MKEYGRFACRIIKARIREIRMPDNKVKNKGD